MRSTRNGNCGLLATLLVAMNLVGCAASLPHTPPVIGTKPNPGVTPAEISAIDPNGSAAYLAKQSTWRTKVRALSGSETAK
jgi:hypothetical protein